MSSFNKQTKQTACTCQMQRSSVLYYSRLLYQAAIFLSANQFVSILIETTQQASGNEIMQFINSGLCCIFDVEKKDVI